MHRKRKRGSDYPRFEFRLRTDEEKEELETIVSEAKDILKEKWGRNVTKKEAATSLINLGIKVLRDRAS